MENKIVRKTRSVCPVCLDTIDANIVEHDDGFLYMEKNCEKHGDFSCLVWEDSAEAYLEWIGTGELPEEEGDNMISKPCEKGCPHDCGPCDAHAKQMTSIALMTSNVCNINCPVCFTKLPEHERYMPSTEELCKQIDDLAKTLVGEYPLELCGGEPTVRDDLDKIIAHANSRGFHHIQLNSNGIRLAEDGYAEYMKSIGVSVVYLGFEGTDPNTYVKKYGRNLLPTKLKAIENCYNAGLPVVFATIVLPDLNGDDLWSIVELAKKYSPVVRGINFQPISYFGTYNPGERVTIPRVIRSLAKTGEIKAEDFGPVRCQHAVCSFQAAYLIGKDGKLKPVAKNDGLSPAKRTRDYTEKAWSESKFKLLTIGGMAFQDAWNFDVERVQRCRIGIASKENGIVPLCCQYLTAMDGTKIYEGIC